MTDTYQGRLSSDGNGNLLAHDAVVRGEETVAVFFADGSPVLNDGQQVTITRQIVEFGDQHGVPVAAVGDGTYVVVAEGEESHNERHEKNVVGFAPTQSEDPTFPGYVDPKKPGDNAHHFEDPTPGALDADIIAERITGHTDAYKEVE